MRYSISFLLLCSLALANSGCPHWLYRQTPRDRITLPTHKMAVVHIETDCARCTGFLVGPHTFVTAAHCFEHDSSSQITAVFVDGYRTQLTLRWKGEAKIPTTDTAILDGDGHGVTPFKIAESNPTPPTMCFSIGYGMENYQKAEPCVSGVMTRDKQLMGLEENLDEVDYGDSGGPVLSSGTTVIGEVILMRDGTPLSYAVPAETLRQDLNNHGGIR